MPDGGGHGVLAGVADGEEEAGGVEPLGEGGGDEDDGGPPIIGEDFEVVPAEVGAKTGTERFRDGLFSGEAARKVGNRILVFVAVILLAAGKEAVEEVGAVPVDAEPDSLDFNEVAAEAFHE